jgi:hypothetical protein
MGTSVSPWLRAHAATVRPHQHLQPQLSPQRRGRVVQVDPMKPTLKAPGSMHLNLRYEEPLSNFAFKFNLRRYTAVSVSNDLVTLYSLRTIRPGGELTVSVIHQTRYTRGHMVSYLTIFFPPNSMSTWLTSTRLSRSSL